MAMRRQQLSHDSRNFHEHNPQKKRTYNAAPAYFTPSIYHTRKYPAIMRPKSNSGELDQTTYSWIGRRIIYSGTPLVVPQPGDILEEHISKYARPNIYRILFIDSSPDHRFSINIPGVRNKVSTDYRPGRMNIFVDELDIIHGISWF